MIHLECFIRNHHTDSNGDGDDDDDDDDDNNDGSCDDQRMYFSARNLFSGYFMCFHNLQQYICPEP